MSKDKPELSRPLALDSLGSGPVTRKIKAEPAELEALAGRFSLVGLNRLEAAVTVKRQSHGRLISVTGKLQAEPVQTCVVTLEPFVNRVEDEFEIKFTTESAATPGAEVEIDPEDLDEPEPLEGGTLDLGELVAQFLSLALDPHPRKPGASFEYQEKEDADQEPQNPFAALKQLKPRK